MPGFDSDAETSTRPLSIFVPHGASRLTDHELNGDGLVQWAVIAELARRGHHLTVVTPSVAIAGTIPDNVDIHEVVEGGSTTSLLRYIARAYAIYRRLSRTRTFDVIHQMNPVVRGVTIPWALSRVPVVLGTYVGDWPYETPGYRMRSATPALMARMAIRLILDCVQQLSAQRLLLATPFARNRVPLWGLVANRIVEIPHGVDMDQYSTQALVGDPQTRESSVLFVGLIKPQKGIAVLLRAFDLVHKELPQAKLVVVGTGELERAIFTYAQRSGWTSQLELVGPVQHGLIAGWLRACSVVCSAALGEPFGQSIVEALACGRPVVVNDSGGPPYIVAGTNNPVVPMGDHAALASALISLLKNPECSQHLGAANRAVAERRYAQPRVVDRLEEVYRGVLARQESTMR